MIDCNINLWQQRWPHFPVPSLLLGGVWHCQFWRHEWDLQTPLTVVTSVVQMLGARRQPVVTLETNCCLDVWRQTVVTIVVKMFCCHYCYPDVWIQPVVSDINKREVGVLSAVSGSESPATEKVVCSGLIYHTHKQKPQFHDTIKSSFLPKLIY